MCGGGLTCIILLALVIGELLAECTFNLNQHVPKTPILIQSAATPPEILYPKQMNVIKLQTGAKFKLTCVDKYFSKNFNKSNKFKDLLLRCNKGDFVEVQRERVRFRDLECEDFPASTVQKNTRKRCYNNSTLFDIGFGIGDRKFLNVIHACFDQLNQDSVYTWYENCKLNLGHQSKVRRPNFAHDNLYTFPNYKIYNSKYQKRRFARIFNSTELAEKYIKDDGRYFLSRGHLSPKADFVYGSEQSATFHYINVAPQWQVFNEGNWQLLEDSVRNEIKKKEKSNFGVASDVSTSTTIVAVD